MTITHTWLGDATSNSATMVVRSDANGAVTMTVDGIVFTGTTISTATNDGVGKVTATGLAADKEYQCIISCAGVSTRRKIKTMPSTAPFKVAFMSCYDKVNSIEALAKTLISKGVNAVFHQGDYVYVSAGITSWFGETIASVTTTSTVENYFAHYRAVHNNPGQNLIENYCPHYFQGDDHELGGDNWDHTVANAQLVPNVASGGTQAQVDASWWKANQAMIINYLGNPTNGDTGISSSTDKPSNAEAGTAASQYPPKYFRKTIGNAEFFVLDCTSYRSPNLATDDSSKTMLGATQKAWLKARLLASTAVFKVIVASKPFYPQLTVGDGWERFTTERAELEAYIATNVISRGVFWVGGDVHSPSVAFSKAFRLACFTCNPAGVRHLQQNAGYAANVIWKLSGVSGVAPARTIAYAGLLEITTEYAEMQIIDPLGKSSFTGRIYAGSNDLIVLESTAQ